jgi:hypothetical protein
LVDSILQEPELLAGWSFDFTRALFGPLPSCDKMQLVHSNPREGCRLQPAFAPGNLSFPGISLAARGTCKFEDKAFIATDAGSSALLVSTSKEGDVSL